MHDNVCNRKSVCNFAKILRKNSAQSENTYKRSHATFNGPVSNAHRHAPKLKMEKPYTFLKFKWISKKLPSIIYANIGEKVGLFSAFCFRIKK